MDIILTLELCISSTSNKESERFRLNRDTLVENYFVNDCGNDFNAFCVISFNRNVVSGLSHV